MIMQVQGYRGKIYDCIREWCFSSKYYRLYAIVLLLIALRIFAWLAAGSNIIFIITWIVSDMVMLLQDNGIISSFSFQETAGLDIHVTL